MKGPLKIRIEADASSFYRTMRLYRKRLRLHIKRLKKFEKESRKAFLKDKKMIR